MFHISCTWAFPFCTSGQGIWTCLEIYVIVNLIFMLWSLSSLHLHNLKSSKVSFLQINVLMNLINNMCIRCLDYLHLWRGWMLINACTAFQNACTLQRGCSACDITEYTMQIQKRKSKIPITNLLTQNVLWKRINKCKMLLLSLRYQ